MVISVVRRAGFVAFTTFTVLQAQSKTLVIPHVFETKGGTGTQAFDSLFEFTYNQSFNGKDTGSATAQVYVYDEATGQPMVGAGGLAVCNPCQIQLNAQTRKHRIVLDDMIAAAGGYEQGASSKSGFAIVTVTGPNEDAVNLQALMVSYHATNDGRAILDLGARIVPPPPTNPSPRKTFVLPHVLESSGRVSDTSDTFDTTIFATYTPGLVDPTVPTSASVDLFLYDQAGQPMVSATGTEVCNPCNFRLGAGPGARRKQSISIDDLITASGGFSAGVKLGFGILVVGGQDPEGVQMSTAVLNRGPLELSVFGYNPEEVSAPAARRTHVIPHILEKQGTINTPFSFDTTIFATYVGGLGGVPGSAGAEVELYLYDDSGAPMQGSGAVVCNPCTFPLSAQQGATRRQVIRIEDLINAAGGFGGASERTGFAVLFVDGAEPELVNTFAFVVNSHTSPFDLAMFPAGPRELGGAGGGGGGSGGTLKKAFVIPHVLEKDGTINNVTHTFDTTIFATYTAGLAGTMSSNGAALNVYLYDDTTGALLSSAVGPVCGPCTFNLDATTRKQSIRIDDLITARGGFSASNLLSLSSVVTQHGDVENLSLSGFVVNSHTGPFDLSVFGFEPQPILASARVATPVTVSATSSGIDISVQTQLGLHYKLESTENLAGGVWVASGDLDGDGLEQKFTEGTSGRGKFYRVAIE